MRPTVLILFASFVPAVAWGQAVPIATAPPALTTTEPLPQYDIVSIKPNDTGSGSQRVSVVASRYFAQNVGVRVLLSGAYGLKQDLILGIPKSIDDKRFDVEAKIVESDKAVLKELTNEQRQAMLRPVLADRFAIQAHLETRVLPIYELIVLPAGVKAKQGIPGAAQTRNVSTRRREFDSHETTIAVLADALSNQLHVPVMDKTGLSGVYDLNLKWSLEEDPPAADNAPSIFTALQEQLGLKLRSTKGPTEVLVVDHIEMPAEN
jgi:uncharacterized protein (TIGR03435 family)